MTAQDIGMSQVPSIQLAMHARTTLLQIMSISSRRHALKLAHHVSVNLECARAAAPAAQSADRCVVLTIGETDMLHSACSVQASYVPSGLWRLKLLQKTVFTYPPLLHPTLKAAGGRLHWRRT